MALPDRIDFTELPDGRVIVTKLRREPEERRDIPIDSETKSAGFDLERALGWCTANGYTVHRWTGGARAWKAEQPWVIRTRREIWKFRQRLENIALSKMRQNPGSWHPEESLLSLDLAYDG